MSDLSPFLVAFVGSLVLTPLSRTLGLHLRIVDNPGELSIHTRPTPRTGGLAMFVAFLSAVLYATNFSGMLNGEDQGKLLALLVGGGLVCLSGLLGDVGRISSRVEISLVMVPAMLAILAGVMVNFIPLIYLSVPLTLFYLIGGSAAMNLLDGMDGLAPGVTAIAAFFFALLGLQHGQPIVLILSLAVLGSALGFLPYNLGILNSKFQIQNPKSQIFMGDCGSLFLGFTLTSLAVLLTSKPYDLIWFFAPILIIGLPVFDTFLAVVRRVINRRHIVSGDRSHLYDLVRDRGMGSRATVLTMYGLGALLGLTGLLLIRFGLPVLVLATAEFLILLALAFRLKALQV